MAWTKCKSGKHSWDSTQKEELEKCCNGYIRMFKPWGNEESGGYTKYGDWFGVATLVKEDDYEMIEKIQSQQPMERRATVLGNWFFKKQ